MNQEMVNWIRQEAQRLGINADVALKVAGAEGGLNNPYRHGESPAPRSQDPRFGPKENSYGPFQLYVSGTGAGLGDRAVAAGIDPAKDWRGGVTFALGEAKNKGWGQWFGAKKLGITGMHGIGDASTTAVAQAGPPGLSLMGAGGGINPSMTAPPQDPPISVATPTAVAANETPAAIAPAGALAAPAAAPTQSIASMLGGGDFKGALGALGGNKMFGSGLASLAGALGEKAPAEVPAAPQIEDNTGSIAQAAPQMLANLLLKKKQGMGLSLGGLA
jgi:hypothetical protein